MIGQAVGKADLSREGATASNAFGIAEARAEGMGGVA